MQKTLLLLLALLCLAAFPSALLAETVATPTFSPDGGTFTAPVNVVVKCATDLAVVHYTTNGETPTEADPIVEWGGTVRIERSTVLKAKAFKAGWTPSAVKAAEYVINSTQTVATPTFSPDSGTYAAPISVVVKCATDGAIIRYTTDGTIPVETSPIILNGDSVRVERNLILKAKAWKEGWSPSAVKVGEYKITSVETVATPSFDPAGGSFPSAIDVVVRCATMEATIRYTTDGTIPDETSTVVANGGTVRVERSLVLKAKAWKQGMNPSAVKVGEYAINPERVATPSFTPEGGNYANTQSVAVRCATPGATIRYTTSGETPTLASPVIVDGGSITVDRSLVLKAKAWKSGLEPSTVRSAKYVIAADKPASVDADLSAGWNMVSVPVAPASTLWSSWTEALGGVTPLAAYTWDPTALMYTEAPDPIPGRGYWVKLPEGSAVVMEGLAVGNTTSLDVHGDADGEWNLIGNPFPTKLTWSVDQIKVKSSGETRTLREAAVAGWLRDFGWSWDSSSGAYLRVADTQGYAVEGTLGKLPPSGSCWLRAFRDCLLILTTGDEPPPPPPGQ